MLSLLNRQELKTPLGTFYRSIDYKNVLHEELVLLAQNMGIGDWNMFYHMPVAIRRRHVKMFNRQQQEKEALQAKHRGELSENMSVSQVEDIKREQRNQLKEANAFRVPKIKKPAK